MLQLIPIPAFNDNYIWLLHNCQQAYCVDPGESAPLIAYLEKNDLELKGILITHHHFDHTGGIPGLLNFKPSLDVYGPTGSNIQGINRPVAEGEIVNLESLNTKFNVIAIPGHTLDHIAYYNQDWLFCGDTLFSSGCGRLFEGSPEQMHKSLSRLTSLDENLQVCCAHEYTLANIAFAKTLEPQNARLLQKEQTVQQLRDKQIPSLPSSIAVEKETNPFLRSHILEIKEAAKRYNSQLDIENSIAVFAALREMKDQF